LAKLYWTFKSSCDGVREREQLQLATLGANLHCHSDFSFLDGVSHPEELAEQAARMGIDTFALTDHDGLYGVVRFAEAAEQVGVRTAFGAELSLDLPGPQNGVPDPAGTHLLVGLAGYRRLARVLSSAHLSGQEKGRPVYDLDEIVNDLAGHALVLTGGRKGPVRLALEQDGPDAAAGRQRLPSAGLLGVEGVLVVTSAPASSSKSTTSVNVPRYRCRSGCGGSWRVLLRDDAPTGHREIAAWTPSGEHGQLCPCLSPRLAGVAGKCDVVDSRARRTTEHPAGVCR
jgi:hypothetical protein